MLAMAARKRYALISRLMPSHVPDSGELRSQVPWRDIKDCSSHDRSACAQVGENRVNWHLLVDTCGCSESDGML